MKVRRPLSLQSRILLAAAAVVIAGLEVLALLLISPLQRDFEKLAAERLEGSASFAAADLDSNLALHLETLKRVAASIPPAIIGNPAAVQRQLEFQAALPQLFPASVIVVDHDGISIAAFPHLPGSVGVSLADRDYFRAVMAAGEPLIGRPLIDPVTQQPVLPFAVPFPGADGRPAGALVGILPITANTMFGSFDALRPGRGGHFVVVSRDAELIVAATDSEHLLQPLPKAGSNELFDRRLRERREETGVGPGPHGGNCLSASRNLKNVDWFVVAGQPTDEAFAPIRNQIAYIWPATILMTILIILVIGLVVSRQLIPLFAARTAMRRMTEGEIPLAPLPIERKDEIGQLLASFNTLIGERQRFEDELRQRGLYLAAVLDNFPFLVWLKDRDGRFLAVNVPFARAAGLSPEEMVGKNDFDVWPRELAERYRADDEAVLTKGVVKNIEEPIERDGGRQWIETYKSPVTLDGEVIGSVGFARDITDRRQAIEQLRLAARVFDNSVEGIVVTDAAGRIQTVNRAFCELTGYSPEECIGQRPSMLQSGVQDDVFYRDFWQRLLESGRWQGELWNRRKSGEIYPEWLSVSAVSDGDGVVTHYVGIFTDLSERKTAEQKIEFLSHYDTLTELPNRLLADDRLRQAMAHAERTQRKVALLLLDLDHFKTINDSLGHEVADAILRGVARTLCDCVRDTDTVCRQGGDVFLAILTDIGDNDAISRFAEKILERTAQPMLIAGNELVASLSIGVAVYPDDGRNFHTLLTKAEAAMRRVKESGRGACRFFDETMNSDALDHLQLRNGLRRALDRGGFVLHYQPQIDLMSGAVSGVEALLRWRGDDGALIPPARFIPVAEESGLIVPIGDWVLREACRQAMLWQQAGLPPLMMAVNLSAVQFRRGDLLQTVIIALTESGLPASCLELELTESLLIADNENVLAVLRALKQLGVKLSIDDFGTGYSSLAYLKRFAVDQLKIDRSFVRDLRSDPEDAAIVRAIAQMGRSLGLRTLAEGVEDSVTASLLCTCQCDAAQGYYFARPLPPEEFVSFFRARQESSPEELE
ncbi:EAL domain-containing protein [Rhodocyclus tenuis]|uniref:EAL domain-containing protein n=1 Tax=Rhodocyclus tenuis TaxID=1066 RepID=UPI001906414E|nr:hypothetical protein [Rhodocyclus tenuis]